MFSVEIVSSIADIDKHEWNRLIDDHAPASHGWLSVVEQTSSADLRPRYVVLRDQQQIIGGTVSYLSARVDEVSGLDDIMFGRFKSLVRKLGLSFLPSLLCGPMNCVGHHLLLDDGLTATQQRAAVHELLDTLEHIASSEGVSLYFWNLLDDQVDLLRQLKARGYCRSVVFPVCYLDVAWSTFDEYLLYLKSFSKNAAQGARKEINRNRKAGVTIERIDDVTPYESRLYELAEKHWSKYNDTRYHFAPTFLASVRQNLGEDAIIYGAFKASKLIGFMLLLKAGDTGIATEIGIDHESSGRDGTYFNIGYYTPIRDAIGARTKRLFFGRGMPQTKMRRGCRTRRAYLYYRAKGGLAGIAVRPLFWFHSLWLQRKIAAQTRSTQGPDRQIVSPRR